jgi:geranylgeranyl reductase family protein
MYDVAILGAGPAGSTCALGLRGSGLQVALLDKASFPRDKACGDAIPALAGKVLHQISPAYFQALDAFPRKVVTARCRVVAPSGQDFQYTFQTPGWTSPRLDFDEFLRDLACRESAPLYVDGFAVDKIEGRAGDWHIHAGSRSIQARTIVGADGASGYCAAHLAGHKLSPDHHCAAVRAYYKGVEGLHQDCMEIHLVGPYLPGYFWIFPTGHGHANVGFGMMRNEISKRKLSLRRLLPELIAQTPTLAARFVNASALGPIQGFGLPLGARKLKISGAGYLLAGDAASLVEPATGEGIGNAMYSGMVAAEVLRKCVPANALRAEDFGVYDAQVYAKLWRGMRQKYWAQQAIAGRAGLLNLLVGMAGRPGPVRWLMRKVF